MSRDVTLEIRICMGSSCFARGNQRNLTAITDYIQRLGLDPQFVRIEGCLCESACANGPHVRINGTLYHRVDPSGVVQLLDIHCRVPESEGASNA